MGHKSGLRKVGAKGKQVPMTKSDLEGALDEGVQVDIQNLALDHVPTAIRTLAKASRRRLTPTEKDEGTELPPWSVSRAAAKDLIEIAGGRPETREAKDTTGGLTIIVNQLTTGESTERVIDAVHTAKEIVEQLEIEVVGVDEPELPLTD